MNFKLKHPLRTLLTGVLALLPLAATLLLLSWLWSFLAIWLGPGSAFGQLLTGIGLGLTESEVIGYLLGLMLVVALVYAFGLMVERGLEQGAAQLLEALVQRIPVVRTVYDVVQKLVGLLSRKDGEEHQSLSPVWLYFGGKPGSDAGDASAAAGKQGTAVLGFLSTPQAVMIGGMPYLGVLVPTAPVPVGGGLLYVPPDWVEPADIGMEGVTSIYVSMGVTSDQYLKKSGL
ncbi:hypothetical protein AEP_01338 [Curvibacter sp. AEP1-3]|uniref:DUF502 domain-containing protein n=1 Tax=Curvibacter sp. AEP1-3 TaxID=1844971 RepID=UPI000B3D2CA4|nr:DUF502 domain-containing protein [Curvibacter sp. AEP1-3]ARV18290.1 hypothetical protein AEP_01338 [Curvibacter sp. AEP1-3]